MYFYHFFNFICSFFISSHRWLVWQEHIHLHCKVKGASGKKTFLFIHIVGFLVNLISEFLWFLLLISVSTFTFFVYCVYQENIYTQPKGSYWKFQAGLGGREVGSKPKSLLATVRRGVGVGSNQTISMEGVILEQHIVSLLFMRLLWIYVLF